MKASKAQFALALFSSFWVANALAQTATKTYDTFSDCYAIASQIDQDGDLRSLAEEQDNDQTTFGVFRFTDKGDVELNLDSQDRGNVSKFEMLNGQRILKVSRGKRLGFKTDNVEHFFSFSTGNSGAQKVSSLYVTGTFQKGSLNSSDSNRWGFNLSFKVDPLTNTCSLNRITLGTEGAPAAYLPKHGPAIGAVAFDLAGCKDLLDLQAKWPNAQYCDRLIGSQPLFTKDLSNDEVQRLQSSKVITVDSYPTPTYVGFCKTYHSSPETQQTFRQARTKAGNLCNSAGAASLATYTQSYYIAHPQPPVGGGAPSTAGSAVKPAQ
jgi:hypothetical protein